MGDGQSGAATREDVREAGKQLIALIGPRGESPHTMRGTHGEMPGEGAHLVRWGVEKEPGPSGGQMPLLGGHDGAHKQKA